MYLVKVFDGPGDKSGIVVHNSFLNGPKLSSGKLNLKISGIDEFEFSINTQNPAFNAVRPLTSLVKVINLKSNHCIFDGRVLSPKTQFEESGAFKQSFICESKLGYLYDSHQRYGEYHDISVKDYLKLLMDRHNSYVEPHKRFVLGNVTVVGSNEDKLYRFLGYEKTYSTIKDKLIDRLGGYLRIREESGITYLDYLAQVGSLRDTTISISRNLKSASRQIDPSNIITRLLPLGSIIEGEEDVSEVSRPRVTIAEANNGIDYLDDNNLQAQFGIIEGYEIWENVSIPATLKSRAVDFLSSQRPVLESWEVSALDLSLIGLDIDSFNVGDYYTFINPILSPKQQIQIVELRLDILNSQDSVMIIGDKPKTLSQYQADFLNQSQSINELSKTASQQYQQISGITQIVYNTQDKLDDLVISVSEGSETTENEIKALKAEWDSFSTLINNTIESLKSQTNAIKLNVEDLTDYAEQIKSECQTQFAVYDSNFSDANEFIAAQNVKNSGYERRLLSLEQSGG